MYAQAAAVCQGLSAIDLQEIPSIKSMLERGVTEQMASLQQEVAALQAQLNSTRAQQYRREAADAHLHSAMVRLCSTC